MVAVFAQQGYGQSEPPRSLEQTRDTYQKALARLEAHFASIHGSGRLVDEVGRNAPYHRTESSIVEFARKPGMYKVLRKERAITPQTGVSPPPDMVGCFNKDMSFRLSKPAGSSSFVVTSSGGVEQRDTSSIRRLMGKFLDAPFASVGIRISDYFSHPGFKLERAEPVTRDNKKLLKLHFRYAHDDREKQGEESGNVTAFLDTLWVTVSPEENWTIYQEEAHYYPAGKAKVAPLEAMNVEYTESLAGFLVPRRIEFKIINKIFTGEKELKRKDGRIIHDGDVTSLATFEFDELHFEELPDSEFTLAAFGLPELGKPETPAARASTTVWYFLAAFVALLLAVGLKYYASRAGTPRSGEAQG
jgi:hypothetical protein